MKRALMVIGGVVLFLATGLGLGLLRQAQRSQAAEKALVAPPPAVTLLRLEQQKVPIRESFYGLIEPWQKTELALRVGGKVDVIGKLRDKKARTYEYRIDEESVVKRDQQILELEDSKAQAALASAKASVEQAKASVLSTRGDISRARAAVEAARGGVAEAEAEQQHAADEFRRVSDLRVESRASDIEMDRITRDKQRADARMKIAQASLQQATAGLEAAEAQLAMSEAKLMEAEALQKNAEVDLSDMVLRAPIDGVISELPIEEGEVVAAGRTVAVLVDVSRVKLVIGVVEQKIPALKLGSVVDVLVESLPNAASGEKTGRKVSGEVIRVAVAADEKTGLFPVEIELANKDGALRSGMVGRAEVVVNEVNGFGIPVESILDREGVRVVFFATKTPDGLTHAAKLTLPGGIETDELYVVSNLAEERRDLVYEGQSRLEDGEEVTVSGWTTLADRWDYRSRLSAQAAAPRGGLRAK